MLTGVTSAVYTLRYDEKTTFEHIAAAGFDSVDFNLYSFCGADHYSTGYYPMAEDGWRDWAEKLAQWAQDAGVVIGQAHAPQFCMMPQDGSFREPEEIFHRAIEACSIFRTKHLVFHPVFYRARIKEESLLDEIMAYNIRWFTHLIPTAERFGVKIALENSFDFPKCQQPGDPRYNFTTGEDMLTLLHGLNHDCCCLCLDTGHANLSGQDVPEMIRAYGKDLAVLHLNDNYGMIGPIYSDIHTFLGFAGLDVSLIFQTLKETGYQGIYNLEVRHSMRKMPDDVLDCTMAYAADALRLYAAGAGIQ